MTDEPLCCALISSKWSVRPRRCGKVAKIVHNGEHYCGLHSPERRQKIQDRNRARWQQRDEKLERLHQRDKAAAEVVRRARLAVRQNGSWDDVAAAVRLLDTLEVLEPERMENPA